MLDFNIIGKFFCITTAKGIEKEM